MQPSALLNAAARCSIGPLATATCNQASTVQQPCSTLQAIQTLKGQPAGAAASSSLQPPAAPLHPNISHLQASRAIHTASNTHLEGAAGGRFGVLLFAAVEISGAPSKLWVARVDSRVDDAD